MNEKYSRTQLLIGEDAVATLEKKSVAVFGIGGVGGFTAEALARAGVGKIALIDNDTVSESNINRQIIALSSTVGKLKTRAMKERIQDINPCIITEEYNIFVLPENISELKLDRYDYVIDAIDTVSGKLAIIQECNRLGVPVISSMGTGNKLDPTQFEVTDIYKTSVCPLARVMRTELKKRGIKALRVLYSKEEPVKTGAFNENGRQIPGSISFVPSVAGLIIAGEVIKTLIK